MSLQSARALRAAGAHAEARALLVELIAQNPSDPMLQYEAAGVNDSLGEEAAAVPYYVAAIAAGLPEEELRGAYLGLADLPARAACYDAVFVIDPECHRIEAVFKGVA